MSKKNIQKLLQQMAGKKKKKPAKKTSRVMALEGRKNFSKGSGENDMVRQAQRDYNGSYISGDLGGVEVGNKSYKKYYKGLI
tara:strand:- start:197 stop:442 length:246 start_codon:yes stop_codon:yes gene_type:complete